MSNSKTVFKPSDIEGYRGETRSGNGYHYWTTSPEDEEAANIREQSANKQAAEPEPVAEAEKKRKRMFERGAGRRTLKRLFVLLLLAAVAGAAYFGFNYMEVTGAATTDQTREADAIVVLGAAQYNGEPSYVLQQRLDHALSLYSSDFAPKIITTGAGAIGDITTEGLAGYEYLSRQDVPARDILTIPEGVNSWEQLSAAAFIMQENGLDSVLLVSDRYHTYRLLDIADELGIEAYVSPSAVEPSTADNLREAAAVSIGRLTGYRRLSAFTE